MTELANLPPDMDRLRWQCRRGMLELDEILSNYLNQRFAAASAVEQAQFRRLLQFEDPVLNNWLLLSVTPDEPALALILEQLRTT